MATITRDLSTKKDANGKSQILFRVVITRTDRPRIKSGLYIKPENFKGGKIVKPRANQKEAAALRDLENTLFALEGHLCNICETVPQEILTKEFLTEEAQRFLHPEKFEPEEEQPSQEDFFFDTFKIFLSKRSLSESRIRQYMVVFRDLKRFEAYQRIFKGKGYKLDLMTFSVEDIEAFEDYLRNEPKIFDKHHEIFDQYPANVRPNQKTSRPLPKGDNTIVGIFKKVRAFFNWCNDQEITTAKPFAKYSGVSTAVYGTPYYLTVEERDQIADRDFSFRKTLEEQRDIFVFQCLIGCRVSDLLRLTPANIINGAVEYIATKTKGERPEVIRVPLHQRAQAILKKYEGRCDDGRLLPFISAQKYNNAIKDILTLCGIKRLVTVLNPTTGREEQRPINEIASSHMARRTFIGNLYKKVKDPNLVGSLSGHKEGSKAFTRYRDIDEDIKKDLINMI